MKRGFTLIEVMVVLVIMAVIVGTAVLGVGTGMKSARLRDAARTVQMYTRHAKAVALLKQRPVVIQFEEVSENGEFVKSRISLSFSGDATGESEGAVAAGRSGTGDGRARTLTGELVDEEDPLAAPSTADVGEEKDPLMAEPREFEGIRIHAAEKEEQVKRSRISVFSTADLLLKNSAAETAKKKARTAEQTGTASSTTTDDADQTATEEEKEASFSVVYEANGCCDPFTVSIFKDGSDEESGLTVNINRFGKVVTEED